HDAPRALVLDPVVHHRVEHPARDLDPRAYGGLARDAEGRDVRVVVVVDEVPLDEGAGAGSTRAEAALRRRRVVVVQGVGDDPGLVVVPLRVLDAEVTP